MTVPYCSVLLCADRWGGSGAAGANQRRQRLAQDYLVWMDQTGELLSLAEKPDMDPVKQERLEVSCSLVSPCQLQERVS